MADRKPLAYYDGKHTEFVDDDTIPTSVIPISSANNQGLTTKPDGLYVDNSRHIRAIRRRAVAGITVQIERCPATSVQVIRVTGTAASTLNNTAVSWDTHPFANTAILFSGVSGDGVGSAQASGITATGANISVHRPGAFHLKFEGSY